MVQYTKTKYLEQLKAWGAPKAPNSNNVALLLLAFFAGAAIGYYLAIQKFNKAVNISTPQIPLSNEMVSALSEKENVIEISEKTQKSMRI